MAPKSYAIDTLLSIPFYFPYRFLLDSVDGIHILSYRVLAEKRGDDEPMSFR